jgi:hypothetical protein
MAKAMGTCRFGLPAMALHRGPGGPLDQPDGLRLPGRNL